ncbi:hypothetical protein [Sinomonas mesophila]|uniref:hypothetical protein n=1 Tax=Sinomonas mesophila TaxID=1531955 RepID=UPI000984CF39|nr:hypothetical protein [Sinomonas mesophila]
MKIDDLLLLNTGLRQYASSPEMDPLTEADALQEAQLLDVGFDALASVVGLMFELRTALQLREANTGVLIARGIRELAWSGPGRDTALMAWAVGSSHPQVMDGLFGLRLVMWPHPGAQLSLTAESAAFFVGDVPGLSEAPPDYTDLDRTTLGQQVAGWESPFEVVSAAFLNQGQ